jgi:hypothetical protein
MKLVKYNRLILKVDILTAFLPTYYFLRLSSCLKSNNDLVVGVSGVKPLDHVVGQEKRGPSAVSRSIRIIQFHTTKSTLL